MKLKLKITIDRQTWAQLVWGLAILGPMIMRLVQTLRQSS
jgi:hypothetical protein